MKSGHQILSAENSGASFFDVLISNLSFQELKKYGVTTVVRVCEATYDATLVVKEGIQVLVCLNSLSFFHHSSVGFFLHLWLL